MNIQMIKWDNTATNPIPNEVLKEILDLSVECKLPEVFDQECDMIYTWVEDKEIVAVAAFKVVLFSDGTVLPRFEHIFGREDVRKSSKGVRFMLNVEKAIFEFGFSQLWAYITNERKQMYEYALRFGFSEYSKDDEGKFLVKNLVSGKKRRF
jgi:N-acetylglutamate synthase-like GNAT family acetyltransferase